VTKASHGFNRPIPNFQLGNHGRSVFKNWSRSGDHRGVHGLVGRFRHGNQILSRDAIDQNQSDSTRRTLDTLKVINVDSLLQKTISRRGPEGVWSMGAKESNCSTRSRRRHRLIRPFAAAEHMKLPAQHGLSRMRQPIAKDHHIGIRASND
jgi:hypothetical protein